MGKQKAKKSQKTNPLNNEKAHLALIINHLQKCADDFKGSEVGKYFQDRVEINKKKLKDLK